MTTGLNLQIKLQKGMPIQSDLSLFCFANKGFAVSFFISSVYKCTNAFASKQTNMADPNGDNLGKMSFARCAEQCAFMKKCFGFNHMYSDQSCQVSTNTDYRLTYQANTVRYTTRFICYSEGKRQLRGHTQCLYELF